jgi:serine/threonine protein kinase
MTEKPKLRIEEAATVIDTQPPPRPRHKSASGEIVTASQRPPVDDGEPATRDGLPAIDVPPHAARVLEARPPVLNQIAKEETAPRIGEYALIARFPSSVTADVYLGYKVTNFGFIRRAVVKWADVRRPDHAAARQTILDEARAISFVDHPNIVTILDLADDSRGTYLAVEYVAGTDLRRVLGELGRRNERFPIPHACYVVTELLRALAHVHQAHGPDGKSLRIVHRDVNPSNVLVSEDGHVKLTDFGTVLMDGRLQTNTAPGMVKGKVRYLAPEYISDHICTFRVDLYSVGVMLFEMLTGRPCFQSSNSTATMLKIVREGLPFQELAEMAVPERLIEVIQKATARDPELRYASADAMCHELEDWLEVAGTFASPSRFSTYLHQHGLFI